MGSCKILALICMTKVGRIDAAISTRNNSGSTMEVDKHMDTTLLVIYCLTLYDFTRPVGVSGCNLKDGSI